VTRVSFSWKANSCSSDVLVRRQGFEGEDWSLDGEMGSRRTYVWFSPFGARNHDAAQKMATTTRPMKGAQLRVLAISRAMKLFGDVYPFAIAVLEMLKRWIGRIRWLCEVDGGVK
jgi:hypothetical protein